MPELTKVGTGIEAIEQGVLPRVTKKIGERYYKKELETEAKTLARNRLIERLNDDPDKMAKKAEICKEIVAEVKDSGTKGTKEVSENFIKTLIAQLCEVYPKNKLFVVLK